jgi:hypothetical protein
MIGALAITACQKGEAGSAPPNVDPNYRDDIGRICDAEKLSGADDQPEGARQMAIAQWLGPAIQTEQAHAFLASIAEIQGADKAQKLRDEAKRVGFTDCALASTWK